MPPQVLAYHTLSSLGEKHFSTQHVSVGEAVRCVVSRNALIVFDQNYRERDDPTKNSFQIDLHHEPVGEIFGPLLVPNDDAHEMGENGR